MIKSYYVDGTAVDQDWIVRNHDLLQDELREDMRRHGYIPVVDQPMNVTWEYVKEKDVFKFRMENKGLKAGRKKALKSKGIMLDEGIVIGSDGDKVNVSLLPV